MANDWAQPQSPYRLRITLDRTVTGRAVLSLDAQQIIDALGPIVVDRVNQETFAFEKTALVNPHTSRIVGRFALVPAGEPIAIDGSFAAVAQHQSPWQGYDPAHMSTTSLTLGGEPRGALLIEAPQLRNTKLAQPLQLAPGQRYLLDYWLMIDAEEYALAVHVRDPKQRLFSELPHSYASKMPPRGEWARQRQIIRANVADASLEISQYFRGRAGVADVRMRPVAWRLIIDSDQPLDEVDLYAVVRAGHRLTVPTDDLIVPSVPRAMIDATITAAAASPMLNRSAVRATSQGASAWTIDPVLPLKVGAMRAYDPGTHAAPAARVNALRGGAASLVIAVDSDRARLDDLQATCDLPANVTFHRLATVPVYDGPTVNGQVQGDYLETRYDPMVPLNYELDPDSADGLHVIIATIAPNDATSPGTHRGAVTLSFGDTSLVLPVELNVSPLRIKPMRHFTTMFGGLFFAVSYPKGIIGMTEDSVPVAAFHGYDTAGLSPDTVVSLSVPDAPDTRTAPIRALAERYFNVMLDHHLAPHSPALYAYYTYDVIERDNAPPLLTNWDFAHGFDDAMRDLVIERDIPQFLVARSNGSLMRRMTLSNGKTYSFMPAPGSGRDDWVQLSRDDYYQLVGDYWDAVAHHLDELGILDRAIYLSDDSAVDTFDDMLAYVRAMRSRVYARRIGFGYTLQKTSAWTRTLPSGALMMDEMLDVPVPFNDDHYNFFEPQWNQRFRRPGKRLWTRNVESDHLSLECAGLSNAYLPLKLAREGVTGWYCGESFNWSMPFGYTEGDRGGHKYKAGPIVNPWDNPFYHHGPGARSFFYPPDPRGPVDEPTNLIIPSYRLTLYRDGIQARALMDVLRDGCDDAGRTFSAAGDHIAAIDAHLAALRPDNAVQWYFDYDSYRRATDALATLSMLPD